MSKVERCRINGSRKLRCMWALATDRARASARMTGGALAVGACLATFAPSTSSTWAAEPLAQSSLAAPVLSVQGETTHWTSASATTVYVVAISNAPRGAAGRTTHYLLTLGNRGESQSYTPVLESGETVYIGVSADGGLTWQAEEVAVTGPPKTPMLGVQGETVQWKALGAETGYVIAISNTPRGATGRVTKYLFISRKPGEAQSYTPILKPGQAVYVGVSADGGLTWSIHEAISIGEEALAIPEEIPTVPVEEAPGKPTEPPIITPTEAAAPVLKVNGNTISWSATGGLSTYTLATILNPTTTRNTTYTMVSGTSYTPPAVPGQTVAYGLSEGAPGEGPWAKEVFITYPATPTQPSEPEESPGGSAGGGAGGSESSSGGSKGTGAGKIIGTNGASGWGEGPAETVLAGHITWDRVEIGSASNTVAQSLADGFKVLAIVGNVSDSTPLSQIEPSQWGAQVVSQIKANPGISIAEAGNEVYYKGGVANPVQYGKMYLAAVNAMKAAGIHIPLLFNMWGDYTSTSGFSNDASGRGWLRDAVNGVPGLAAAIVANGLSSHPYGSVGENYEDEAGVNALAAQEAIASSALGTIPPFYITEFGYDMGSCGAFNGACSQQEQASELRTAYEVFLADPHMEGIWWYESHDDSTGQFGFMNSDGSTRPSFNVLSAFAVEQGQ